VLGGDYDTFLAENGPEGLKILEQETVSLIITDQRMPGMTGVQVLQESLKIQPDAVRILLTGYTDIQALIDAINSGQIYKYVQKPWDAEDLKLTVKRALESLELKQSNDRLVLELRAALSQLENISLGTIFALANALDAKCDYTSGHSLRVSRYAVSIGLKLGLAADELKDLELAGILHDIGKIGVPESILWKPGRLDAEEQKLMAIHPEKSAQMLEEIEQFERVRLWVRHHHEHLDGSGYPDKLAGNDIPLGARVVLVADAYDAMTSDRPYRQSIGYERAGQELRKYSGKQFDPEMVDALLSVVGENGEYISSCGIPESFLGLKLGSIDPKQSGKQYLAESARRAQTQEN
ncbi:MAG: HD domain-containing protein, partial [Candidatus Obscuribacterales bacterium]|nr:HD domain-containing protein [Candidatus Obscuribacterales bacterium]